VSHRLYPVGASGDGRARRAGHGGRFSGREVVLRSDDQGDAPAPPHYLDPREIEVFLGLWAEPVAKLWEPSDADLVALLARMVVKNEDGAEEAWVSARIMSLRSALFLSPRTRRASGIHIERAEPRDENVEQDEVDDVLAGMDEEIEQTLMGSGL
jgi:hypothetical protein